MRILILVLFSILPASAVQSIILTSGNTGTFTVPASSPFTTLAGNRIEGRVHAWTSANAVLYETAGWAVKLRSADEFCVENKLDPMSGYGGTACVSIAGVTDFTFRARRDTTALRLTLEVWPTTSGVPLQSYCGAVTNKFLCPMDSADTDSSAGAGVIGGTSTAARLAWIKWKSGAGTYEGPIPEESDTADLGDWKFEGNGTDSSGQGMTITHSLSYGTSPVTSPVPIVRQQAASAYMGQIGLRAGFSHVLDATYSFATDGNVIAAYFWQQISGPSTLQWSGRTTATPTIDNVTQGSYQVRLLVADSTGSSGSVDFQFGAVGTDTNGVLVQANTDIEKIVGPQIRLGASPWPWMDERHEGLSDYFAGLRVTDVNFQAFWRNFGAGTISVTNGNATVTGSGTAFQTLFACNGTDYLVVKYTETISGIVGGYRTFNVASCASQTSLTLAEPYSLSTASGLNYARETVNQFVRWTNQGDNINYYDNVLAHYVLWVRTGNTLYRDRARALADDWIENPHLDYFRAGGTLAMNASPRMRALAGLVLRALDGRSDFWPGLRLVLDPDVTHTALTTQLEDIREEGFRLQHLAFGAMFDPDSGKRTTYTNAVNAFLDNRWGPHRHASGYWLGTIYQIPHGSGADVVNGTSAVTSAGAFSTATCTLTCTASDFIWFHPSDAKAYKCVFNNASSITLKESDGTTNANYLGTTGSKQWSTCNLVGPGVQPFMLGIVAQSLEFARRATAHASLPTWINDAVAWLRSSDAYRATPKGLFYGALFPLCPDVATAEAIINCRDSGDGDGASRFFASEVIQAFGSSYALNGLSATKDRTDTHIGVNFGKPGFGGPETGDGWWYTPIDPLDPGFIPNKSKDFGFLLGVGNTPSWAAARLGGVAAADNRTYTQPCDLTSIQTRYPTIARQRIVLTAPNGATAETICSSGTASLTVDRRMAAGGRYLRTSYYETTGGAAIVTSASNWVRVL